MASNSANNLWNGSVLNSSLIAFFLIFNVFYDIVTIKCIDLLPNRYFGNFGCEVKNNYFTSKVSTGRITEIWSEYANCNKILQLKYYTKLKPTKPMHVLVNMRKHSIRLVRAPSLAPTKEESEKEQWFHVEFTVDCSVPCTARIHYLVKETPKGKTIY